jgi:VIT1/CCC1 family predicted Fe2+/Mn2+ transporter
VCAFGVALPLFVYAFLSGGWVTRLSMGLLR